MAKIVGIGANVCDTLITVPSYPKEDTKMRANSVALAGGGPCATGLVAATKLGVECAYLGTLTDDNPGKFLLEDFKRYGVLTDYITVNPGYTSFCSFVILSEDNATRTCVFHKGDIPKCSLDEKQKEAIKKAEILMVDGNEIDAAVSGAKIAKQNNTKVLYDAGGLYDGVEELLMLTDILIPSEEFALGHTKADCVEDAAKILYDKYKPEVVVITCGKKGGIMYDGTQIREYPAFLVDAVDSNGSGDVFHGAFAFSKVMCYDYYKACVFSSAVSALKCTKVGARKGSPLFHEVSEFLKERGINV